MKGRGEERGGQDGEGGRGGCMRGLNIGGGGGGGGG